MTGKSDGELAGLALNGDERAFREIMARHRRKILSICLAMLRDIGEAEEAAQEVFVKIYFNLSKYDPGRDFAAWAGAVAVNECRDRLRRKARYSRRFREISERDQELSRAPETGIENSKYSIEEVERAIEKLPLRMREVIILKAYSEYSYQQIAKTLRIRVGTVMSRLHRAREKLAELLERGLSE